MSETEPSETEAQLAELRRMADAAQTAANALAKDRTIERRSQRRFTIIAAAVVLGIAVAFAVPTWLDSRQSRERVDQVKAERTRALKGECHAANVAIAQVRHAINVTAGYQSVALPGASPELAAQIKVGNLHRAQLAADATAKIQDIRCIGDPPVTTTTVPPASLVPGG